MRKRLALSALIFGAASSVAYVLQRLLDYARGEPVTTAALLGQSHVSLYWRAGTALWWGGLLAIVGYALLTRGERAIERVDRFGFTVLAFGVSTLILAWFFP